MTPQPAGRERALRAGLWLLLGGWIGAWLLFGFGVTTTAFRVLPSTELAGRVVGPILSGLNVFGAVAGAALALLAVGMGRGRAYWLTPLVLAGLCLYSEFVITPGVQAVRDGAFGPDGSLRATEQFTRLHQRSFAVFIAVGLGAIVLLVLHARKDARGKNPTHR